jgi:hypothetical protein
MKRTLIILLIGIGFLILLGLYLLGLTPFNYAFALPYQSCGGSKLTAKNCVQGFVCKLPGYSGPPPAGAGGTCVLQ